MKALDILGFIAGLFTSISIIPQIITSVKKQKAEDVSIFMFIIMLTGNALWVYYGFAKKDIAVIATNIFALILNIIMLCLKIKYKGNK